MEHLDTHRVVWLDHMTQTLKFKYSLTMPPTPRRDAGVSYTDGSWGHDYTGMILNPKTGLEVYLCGSDRDSCLHRTATCSTQGKFQHTELVPVLVAQQLLGVLKQAPFTPTQVGICRSCLARPQK